MSQSSRLGRVQYAIEGPTLSRVSSFVVDGEEKSKAAYGVDDGRSSHMSSGAVWRYAALQAVLTTE
jgi:hypothetical protein